MTLHPTQRLPRLSLKAKPEDFVVEEVPAYEASGVGEHVFVTFQKTNLTTTQAVRMLAQALDTPARDAGVAGQKDKVAVTTQVASFFVPTRSGIDVEQRLAQAAPRLEGISVLRVSRHNHKLKAGHLLHNRFDIRLHGVSTPEDAAAVRAYLSGVEQHGVPNHYGSQRFGAAGDNARNAAAFVRGERKPPRDAKQARFLFSSLQSALFNELLTRRVADGSWCQVLPGDVAKKQDTGGLFVVADSGPELEDAQQRARDRLLSATGPMFGASMMSPRGVPAQLEAEVLERSGVSAEQLAAHRHLGEGTRRPLRMIATDLRHTIEDSVLRVIFTLPKGGYATTLLAALCEPVEAEADEPDLAYDARPPAEDVLAPSGRANP